MTRLTQVSGEAAFRALLRAGWQVVRQGGSHAQLTHPERPGRRVTVARHRDPMPKGTLAALLRQAGLTADEFREFL